MSLTNDVGKLSIIAFLILLPCLAAAQEFDFSVDVPADISGTDYLHYEIIGHDGGIYTVAFSGTAEGLSGDVNIIAIALLANGDLIFSADAPFTASSTDFLPGDIVRWDGATYTIYKSGSAIGLPASGNINALALNASGLPLVSFDVPETISATTYEPIDIVRINGDDTLSMHLDGSSIGIPSDADLTGYHELCNGEDLFCFDAPVDLGGSTYIPGEIIKYDGSYIPFYSSSAFPDYAGMTGFYIDGNVSASPATDGPACPGGAVNFTAGPSGGVSPYTYTWDFGDGSGTSTLRNPSYTYGLSGTYRACVVVTDSNGCSSPSECTDVTIYSPPSASASNEGPACPGDTVSFASNPSGGSSPYSYAWDFGDGTGTSTLRNPSYTYAVSNSYMASVIVTDSNGCSSSASFTPVDIMQKPSAIPTSDTPSCAEINFTANATGGVSPYIFEWDFGDGAGSSTARNPTYTYHSSGSYMATLWVTDSNGCRSDAHTHRVWKEPAPTAAPAAAGACEGWPMSFSSNPSGGTTPYEFE